MASSVLGGAREGVALRVAAATRPAKLDNPAWRLYPLKGDLKGHWSVRVTNNWRITFRLKEGEAVDINLIDYH